MANVTADFLILTPTVVDGATTPTATISKTLTFVKLSTKNVTLTLPAASGGTVCKVVISAHPPVALTNGVVYVVPASGDTIDGGAGPATLWELDSSLTFVAVDSTDWRVTDVL
jgi:hypothetical protein